MRFLRDLIAVARGRKHGRHDFGATAALLTSDHRLHPRYQLPTSGLLEVTLPSGRRGAVINISYSGMAAYFPALADPGGGDLPPPGIFPGTLRIMDQEIHSDMELVRHLRRRDGASTCGITIIHQSPASLLAIREFIEPLRCGMSLTVLPPAIRQEQYRDSGWLCLRGDGPTDLMARSSVPGGPAVEVLLTFRFNDRYREVRLDAGGVATGKEFRSGNSPMAIGGQMVPTGTLDREILRQAIAILAGVPAEHQGVLAGLLERCVAELRALPVRQETGTVVPA